MVSTKTLYNHKKLTIQESTASASQPSRFLSTPTPSTSRKRRRVEENDAHQGGKGSGENGTGQGGVGSGENGTGQGGMDNECDYGGNNGADGERDYGGDNEHNNGDDNERNNDGDNGGDIEHDYGDDNEHNNDYDSDRNNGYDSEHGDDQVQPPPSHAEQETDEVRAIRIEEIKIANEFSRFVKSARLGDEHDGLDEVHRERLRHQQKGKKIVMDFSHFIQK